MFTQTKLGSLLGAFGAVGGAFYAVKKGKDAQNIAIIAVAVGLVVLLSVMLLPIITQQTEQAIFNYGK